MELDKIGIRGIVIDIETKPDIELAEQVGYLDKSTISPPANWKDPEKIERYIEEKHQKMIDKLALNPHFARVVIGGCYEIEQGNPVLFTGDEKIVLIKVLALINDWNCYIISFNAKKYDIPVILQRAMLYDLEIDFNRINELIRPYSVKHHFDLNEFLAGGLDLNSRIYLDQAKDEIDFATCSLDELKEHNRVDLTMTANLYKKIKGGNNA